MVKGKGGEAMQRVTTRASHIAPFHRFGACWPHLPKPVQPAHQPPDHHSHPQITLVSLSCLRQFQDVSVRSFAFALPRGSGHALSARRPDDGGLVDSEDTLQDAAKGKIEPNWDQDVDK
jgi:hypothetical protein